jgi:hypothetical protein
LESVYRGNSIEGSNPSLSARIKSITYREEVEPSGNDGKSPPLPSISLSMACVD